MRFNNYKHDGGALTGVLDWVDPRFGIVRKISAMCLSAPDPQWWVYACELARAPTGTWHSLNEFSAAGCSINPDEAFKRALGEVVERYSALSQLDASRFTVMKPSENEITTKLPRCAEYEQCSESFKKWDFEMPITYVEMNRLSGRGSAHVPAGYATLSFVSPTEPPVTLPISTGLAFQLNEEAAIWRGLCEAIERDSMMLMWWTRTGFRKISLCSNLPEGLTERLDRLNRVGLHVNLFDITSDLKVPAVFCIIRGQHYPYFVVGASCHENPEAACIKAIDEAVSGRVASRFDKWSGEITSLKEFNWVQRLEHHMTLYAHWSTTTAFDFLFNANECISFEEFQAKSWLPKPNSRAELEKLAAELEQKNIDVLWMNLTTEDSAIFGQTVKVFIPQMVPLSQDHRVRWLGTDRLIRSAKKYGVDPKSFNNFPHPFA